ncbi:toll-like receptor 13 [Labrus mixtus]|uniref:toll-like receptor 13 n=1 Tax=Labrus mixtus TaxID=508554 RepID=UPI0029C0C331|nr:toll-like receptor 13 [Labrus mixtus]
MPATESFSSQSIRRLLVLLLCLLLHYKPILAYSLKNCSFDFFEDALAEVCLDCSSRELVAVPDDIPRDACSLRLLILNSNLIAHIDDGSFMDLVALKKLCIRDNQLTHLTENLFQGLSNLTLLDLSKNNLHFIHSSAFHFLSSLETVILDFNKLGKVNDIQSFLLLPHLQTMSIRDNLLSSFESKDLLLNVSSGLKLLDVAGNDLRRFSITTHIFPHLRTINLCRCGEYSGLKWDIHDKSLLRNITQLHFSYPLIAFEEIQNVLQSLDSLQHLQLNFMKPWIDKGLLATVCKIPTFKKLDLSFNYFANLSAKFGACSQLRELDLSCAKMTELPKGTIGMMRRLRSLNLEINLLTIVPYDIRSLRFLKVLKLGNNRISELGCEDFKNTSRLTELFLNNNHIVKLDSCVFQNLNSLKVLRMSENLLWTFGGAFKIGPQNLEVLDLGKHFVDTLEKGDFEGLGSLKHLDIVSDNIGRVKLGAFDGLNNLTSLTVSLPIEFENNFRTLQVIENLTIYFHIDSIFQGPPLNINKAIFHLESLKKLKMVCTGDHHGLFINVHIEMLQSMKLLEDFTAENIFISAPSQETFQFNSQLKSLTIKQSPLSDLSPELFRSFPNLQELDLRGTTLKSLDFVAQANLSALRSLQLSDNAITVINERLFQTLPALIYLDLDNNPLTCDCSNAGFIQWVKSNNQTQVDNAFQFTCSFPLTKQGTKLLDFDFQSCWIDFSFLCFMSSTCLVVLTLLPSFIYHFLRWQLVYAFHLFLAFLYDSRKRGKGVPHLYDAFISYNIKDEAWVYGELLPALEGEQGWRLCLHHRDFQPGKPIIENITDAIYGSRKTICVISRSYLQSEWCSREIQMASFRLFDEQKDVLILLFLEEIPAQQLSPYYRMRKLVKKHTYLSWSKAGRHTGVFWQGVRRALETGDSTKESGNLLSGPAGC